MSKAWGGIGAWAADAERAEAEERELQEAAEASALAESQSFPSLKEAAAAKPKKKKAMTLAEFTATANTYGGGGSSRYESSTRPTPDEMLRLPTGPKERSADEIEYGRLGGGFRSYGHSSGPPPRRQDDSEGHWGGAGRRSYGGGFDDDRRGALAPRSSDYDLQPSRADEVDNWAAAKKPVSMGPSDSSRYERGDRYSSLGGGAGGGFSRADEVDSWASEKKPLPARSGYGSGFRDSGGEPRERPRLVLDKPRGGGGASAEPVKSTRPSPFGAARPREEVLADKGLDWKKLDSEIETKKTTSRPASAQSSRPSSAQSIRPESPGATGSEGAQKPRPKINPFGDAKPREVLLQEQGIDWRKMDLELERRALDRPETMDEKLLKEKIDHLKELAKDTDVTANGESANEKTAILEEIHILERDLEVLSRDLDSKMRFGQRSADRPGSGRGRVGGFPDRPSSQSGRSEDARSIEFSERPRSRGTGDIWTRAADDRRIYQGGLSSGKEGGFRDSGDFDRSRSRERW